MPVGTLPVMMFHSNTFNSIIKPSDLFQKHKLSSKSNGLPRELSSPLQALFRLKVPASHSFRPSVGGLQGIVGERGIQATILNFPWKFGLHKQYLL